VYKSINHSETNMIHSMHDSAFITKRHFFTTKFIRYFWQF